ncbi:MAG: response regulator [Nitrospina sp.]|mgnify:FL=1|jgi:CheY-like chemotaxis protein|nr:response regulator [Nitrospina sp.]MBT5631475.1 response regulator [Nitrospina sp.]
MKSILVVDDEQNIRFLYKEELEDDGYKVSVAATGEEALKKLDKSIPDLIILDIKMPGMDGIEVMRKIKDEKGDIPIILCSAYGRYKQDFRAWASDAYVVKSADLRELKLTIKEILNQRIAG